MQWGLFQPIVMPFGMCNAPASFQAMITSIFCDYIDQGQLTIYMDDILVHTGDTWEDHHNKVNLMLQQLLDNNLYLKLLKCHFDKTEVAYLGLIVSYDTIAMDPKKLQGVADWVPLKDPSGVQHFLGFTGFYRHFVQNYLAIAYPLLLLI